MSTPVYLHHWSGEKRIPWLEKVLFRRPKTGTLPQSPNRHYWTSSRWERFADLGSGDILIEQGPAHMMCATSIPGPPSQSCPASILLHVILMEGDACSCCQSRLLSLRRIGHSFLSGKVDTQRVVFTTFQKVSVNDSVANPRGVQKGPVFCLVRVGEGAPFSTQRCSGIRLLYWTHFSSYVLIRSWISR